MNFNDRIEAAKPYILGFVVGIIAAPAIGFGAGWVATSSAQAEAVENARIETLSSVCSASAHRAVASRDGDLDALKGFSNRAAREEVVTAAMADITVPENLVRRV